jgi:hypothetical protein
MSLHRTGSRVPRPLSGPLLDRIDVGIESRRSRRCSDTARDAERSIFHRITAVCATRRRPRAQILIGKEAQRASRAAEISLIAP